MDFAEFKMLGIFAMHAYRVQFSCFRENLCCILCCIIL